MGGRSLRDQLRRALAEIDDVEEGDAIFDEDERAFFLDGRQIAEFAGPNTIGVRLTWPLIRERKEELASDPRVDKWRSGTDWLTIHFRRQTDLPLVVDLAAAAATQYRPAPGQPRRPPPSGADLARRRRFH